MISKISSSKLKVPGVFIIELDLPHDRGVVPVTEDNKRQAVIDVSPQLGDLFREILLLAVHHQQCAYRDTKAIKPISLLSCAKW